MGKVKKLGQKKKDWWVYILECADKTLYTGLTNDLTKRLKDHSDSKIGAKYTRSRRPLRLVYKEKVKTRGAALSREIEIKKLKRGQKIDLVR